jgi:hypothetical protein
VDRLRQGAGLLRPAVLLPVDEPHDAAAWSKLKSNADQLHAADPAARIIITSSIGAAKAAGADQKIDILCPVLDALEARGGGSTRAAYDPWLAAKPARRLWAYQSCDQHGCGACHDPSPGVAATGWPNRVIDSSGVQDRAFPWHAFRLRLSGELYWDTGFQLSTAWNDDGQCAFSGSGDGTLFYPGLPGVIGGSKEIPIESLRMKLIREGMEDYEYLVLAAKKDPALARSVAEGLFPKAYESARKPAELEAARHKLFLLLDEPLPAAVDGGRATLDAGLRDDAVEPTSTPDRAAGDATRGQLAAQSPGCTVSHGTGAWGGGAPVALWALLAATALLLRRGAPVARSLRGRREGSELHDAQTLILDDDAVETGVWFAPHARRARALSSTAARAQPRTLLILVAGWLLAACVVAVCISFG